MVISVKLKPNIRGSNRFERKFLFYFYLEITPPPPPPPPPFFFDNNFFFFKIKITKTKFFFLLLQASSLNILDAGFEPDFKKENNSSSSSSIRLEYFKRRLRVGFYNRVQDSGF